MATERELFKNQQLGQFTTVATSQQNARAAVQAVHTRTVAILKVGTENADTNVAETLMFRVARKSIPTIYYTAPTTVAGNATNYVHLFVSKKTAGVDGGIVAQWNTHTSAQSSFTSNVPFQLVTNTSLTHIEAGDTLHYTKRTVANGASVGVGVFTVELEEV